MQHRLVLWENVEAKLNLLSLVQSAQLKLTAMSYSLQDNPVKDCERKLS